MRHEPRLAARHHGGARAARGREDCYLLGPGFHPGALLIATVGPAAGAAVIALVALALRIGL
ncbi:MAG: hypothetical protein PGN34_17205 [Methylobacterium frigidaeris]